MAREPPPGPRDPHDPEVDPRARPAPASGCASTRQCSARRRQTHMGAIGDGRRARRTLGSRLTSLRRRAARPRELPSGSTRDHDPPWHERAWPSRSLTAVATSVQPPCGHPHRDDRPGVRRPGAGRGRAKAASGPRRQADERSTLLAAVRDRYCELAPRGGETSFVCAPSSTVRAGDVPTPSELETELADVLSDPRVPPIEWQAPFPGRCRGEQRVDGTHPRLVAGHRGRRRAWHTRVDDFERDRRRDAEAAAAGLQTLRFTWHQLRQEAAWVRGIVLDTGARRSAAGALGYP